MSDAFNVNVIYGFYPIDEYTKLLEDNYKVFLKQDDDKIVVLGRISKSYNKTYILIANYYQQKKLLDKYGLKLFNIPDYWFVTEDIFKEHFENQINIKEEIKEITTPFFSFYSTNDDADFSFWIYKNLTLIHTGLYYDWWNFCCFFVDKYRPYCKEDMIIFRRNLRNTINKIGGNEAVFINGQSSYLSGIGQGEEIDKEWNEVKNIVIKNTGENLIDIPLWFTDSEYKRSCETKPHKKVCLIDDFRDLDIYNL